MAAGLPIVCSNKGPMPEVLGDAGVYIDPENVESIVISIRRVIFTSQLREAMANQSFIKALEYSWVDCANSTFDFLVRNSVVGKSEGKL